MQAIFQPCLLKNINVECRFKMLLYPNGNQMFPEAHESQEKTFRRVQAALDWFPSLTHPGVALSWSYWLEQNCPFCYAGGKSVRGIRPHSLKSTSLCCQTGWVTGIKDLANDHRTAKITLDACTPLEKLTKELSEVAQTQRIISGVCM